jgi:hypothetical protein
VKLSIALFPRFFKAVFLGIYRHPPHFLVMSHHSLNNGSVLVTMKCVQPLSAAVLRFYRQRQDERLRRGGEQKSVVILSERPYSSVFKPLVQIAGPLYFDIGGRALEQVASYVSRWAAPLHGQFMELLVGSITLRAHLPPAHTLPPGCGTPMDDFTSAMAPAPPLNRSIPQGVFHEVDLFGSFRGVLMNLWVLWELLLVGEPLLVIAPTPSQVCEAVACLVGLVAPLPCSVDFRPYFTIHDPDFGGLNSVKEGEKGPPMVLGVTNLFFLKALRNIPHVISVGTSNSAPNRLKLARASSQNGNRRLSLQFQLSPLTRFSPVNLLKVARVRKDGPLALMTEHRECLWTSYVAATKPDTSVLNRLVDAGVSPRTEESMSMVNNEVLRRHFLELTTNFLAPFGPYLRATTPQEGTSPFRDPPPLPPFNAHDFLQGLSARGAGKFLAKRLRANWLDLYRSAFMDISGGTIVVYLSCECRVILLVIVRGRIFAVFDWVLEKLQAIFGGSKFHAMVSTPTSCGRA